MVTFNIHWGMQREQPKGLTLIGPSGVDPKANSVANTGNYYAKASPKKALIMANPKEGKEAIRYDADQFGNIEVSVPAHLHAMRQLGYPIYIGNGNSQVVWEDLIWPRFDLTDDPYYREILQGIKSRKT